MRSPRATRLVLAPISIASIASIAICAATVILAALAAGPLRRGVETAVASGATDQPFTLRLRFERIPARPRPGAELTVKAVLSRPTAAKFKWKVDAGHLHSDDRQEVVWNLPTDRRQVEIEVVARVPGKKAAGKKAAGKKSVTIRHRETINLRPASLDGMVRIPGGVYTIGDTWTDLEHPGFIFTNQNRADKPAHRVKLSPYYIGVDRVDHRKFVDFLNAALREKLVTEVTKFAVLGRHRGSIVPYFRFSYDDMPRDQLIPELLGAIRWNGRSFIVDDDKAKWPVVDVTWVGSLAYARYHGHRLATNAEWEVAARGRDNRRYPWGDDLPTPSHANVNNYFGNRIFPVGSFSPAGDSPFGVHDMMGSIFEWVHDWYDEQYYEDTAGSKPLVNPRGPHWGKDRVIRGIPYDQGVIGALHEQPPLSFRYAWVFEFPIGDGVATNSTTFRTVISSTVAKTALAGPGPAETGPAETGPAETGPAETGPANGSSDEPSR